MPKRAQSWRAPYSHHSRKCKINTPAWETGYLWPGKAVAGFCMVLVGLGGTCIPWPESSPDQVYLIFMHRNILTQHPSCACYPYLGVRWWCHPWWQVILRLRVFICHPPILSKAGRNYQSYWRECYLIHYHLLLLSSPIHRCCYCTSSELGLQSNASWSLYFCLTLKKPEAWINYVQLKFNYVPLNCLFCLSKLSIQLGRSGIMYNLRYCHSMVGFFVLQCFYFFFSSWTRLPIW